MTLSSAQMQEMFDSLPNGELDNGEVLSDALALAGYTGAARALNKFLVEAWPIEREIRRERIPEGPLTQRLYAQLPKPLWFNAKRYVRMAIAMETMVERGSPLVWYNVEAGGYAGPDFRRRVKRNTSFPVLFRGVSFAGISSARGKMVGVVSVENGILPDWTASRKQVYAVQQNALSPMPRYALAPNSAIYRNVMR